MRTKCAPLLADILCIHMKQNLLCTCFVIFLGTFEFEHCYHMPLYKFIIQKLTCWTKRQPVWLQKLITCCLDSALTAYSFAGIISVIFAKVITAKIKNISLERIVKPIINSFYNQMPWGLKLILWNTFPKNRL